MGYCCWYCTLDIKGQEFQLPFKQDRGGKIHSMGKFCSWECVKTYNLKENRLKFGEIQGLITLTRKKMYGKTTRLGCVPDKYLLEKFGGPLSEEEYRLHMDKCPLPVMRMPETHNFLHYNVKTEKYVPKKKESEKAAAATEKMSRIQHSAKADSETLKLKRPIPIKHTENNLESALGIIRRAKNS